jgi:hypothetical protein
MPIRLHNVMSCKKVLSDPERLICMLCSFASIGFTLFDVTLGSSRLDVLDPGSRSILSISSFVHEEYNSSLINNDIALIKLPQIIDFTRKYSY